MAAEDIKLLEPEFFLLYIGEAYQGGIQASYRWLEANQRLASLTLNYFMGLNRTLMDSFIKPIAQGDVRSHGQPGEQFRPK